MGTRRASKAIRDRAEWPLFSVTTSNPIDSSRSRRAMRVSSSSSTTRILKGKIPSNAPDPICFVEPPPSSGVRLMFLLCHLVTASQAYQGSHEMTYPTDPLRQAVHIPPDSFTTPHFC